MARLTAGLVVSAVMLIVLGVGVTPGNGQGGVGDLFAGVEGGIALTYFRSFPTMRIISSANPNLCLAVSGGNVVIARKSSTDPSQAWIQDDRNTGRLATEDECRKTFALVNFDDSTTTKLQAIVPPPSNNPLGPARIAPYDPFKCVRPSVLWTQGNPNNPNGFYTIQMFLDKTRAFNFLGQQMVLGVRTTQGVNKNVLWKIVPF